MVISMDTQGSVGTLQYKDGKAVEGMWCQALGDRLLNHHIRVCGCTTVSSEGPLQLAAYGYHGRLSFLYIFGVVETPTERQLSKRSKISAT